MATQHLDLVTGVASRPNNRHPGRRTFTETKVGFQDN
jgi:hypothetical protein